MPTFRNDSVGNRYVIDISGKQVKVPPAGTVETYEFLSPALSWVEVSETPIYDPILSRQTITLTTEGVAVSFDPVQAKRLYISGATGTITAVHVQNASTTPPLFENITSASPLLTYDNADGFLRKLVFKGTGTCVLEIHKN